MPEGTFRRNKMLVAYVTEREREVINRLARKFGFRSTSTFLWEAIQALQNQETNLT